MPIEYVAAGLSRSFPDEAPAFFDEADGLVLAGEKAGVAFRNLPQPADHAFCAIELGTECLAEHVGLEEDDTNRRAVGFARFRLGDAAPSPLVEIVRLPWTSADTLAGARLAFESMSLKVAVCEDIPGRIVDRLIRPYLNAVLRRHDQKLASAADLDKTMRLGLGYPEGPLALLSRTGLSAHFDVTQALHEALGDADFAPARAAQVAKTRAVK